MQDQKPKVVVSVLIVKRPNVWQRELVVLGLIGWTTFQGSPRFFLNHDKDYEPLLELSTYCIATGFNIITVQMSLEFKSVYSMVVKDLYRIRLSCICIYF